MKLAIASLALAAVALSGAAAFGQNVPAQFVVSGKAAEKIQDFTAVNLATAERIADSCEKAATDQGVQISLMVLDISNNMHSALLKAQTALKTRQPTSIRAAQLKNDPGGLPRYSVFFNLYPVAGGVPIVVDGQMIGALGVGGIGGGDQDEMCAVAGLKAAFGDHVAVPVYPAAAGPAQ